MKRPRTHQNVPPDFGPADFGLTLTLFHASGEDRQLFSRTPGEVTQDLMARDFVYEGQPRTSFAQTVMRVSRHLALSRAGDDIAYLDLAHAVRVLMEYKSLIDENMSARGLVLRLPCLQRADMERRISKRGNEYLVMHLPNSVAISGGVIYSLVIAMDEKTDEEIRRTQKQQPQRHLKDFRLADWLGGLAFESKFNDCPIQVTREQLVRRVANAFGASHRFGAAFSDEHNIDPIDEHLVNLFTYRLLGVPLPYILIMHIAEVMLKAVSQIARQ